MRLGTPALRLALLLVAASLIGVVVTSAAIAADARAANLTAAEDSTYPGKQLVSPQNELVQDATIRGYVFVDLNANGIWDQGPGGTASYEPGLEGWEVHLVRTLPEANAEPQLDEVTWTDETGFYTFDVPAGTYAVSEVCPPGWAQSLPTPTNRCGSGIRRSIRVSPGQLVAGVDFGNYRYPVLSGHKYLDFNENGTRDPGEPGLRRWQIHMAGPDNQNVYHHWVAWTDGLGFYAFDENFRVPPGSYVIWESCPAGWIQTYPPPTSGCGSGVYAWIDLLSGQVEEGKDFGNYAMFRRLYLPVLLHLTPALETGHQEGDS